MEEKRRGSARPRGRGRGERGETWRGEKWSGSILDRAQFDLRLAPANTSHPRLIIIRLDAGTEAGPEGNLCRSTGPSTHTSPPPLPRTVRAAVPTDRTDRPNRPAPPRCVFHVRNPFFHLLSRSASCGVLPLAVDLPQNHGAPTVAPARRHDSAESFSNGSISLYLQQS